MLFIWRISLFCRTQVVTMHLLARCKN